VDGTGREVEVVWVRTQPRRALLLLVTVLAVSLAAMAAVAWFGPPAGASSPLHHPGRQGWTEKGPNHPPPDPALPPVSLTAVPPSQWAAPGPVPPGSLTQTITVTLGHGRSDHGHGEGHGHGHGQTPATTASGAALSVAGGTGSPGETVAVQGSGFRPGAPVRLTFAVPCADCVADATVAHPDTAGGFIAGLPITSLSGPAGEAEGDNAVVADQPASGLRASVALSVVPLPTSPPSPPAVLAAAGGVTQTFEVSVEPGPLTISEQSTQVTLHPIDRPAPGDGSAPAAEGDGSTVASGDLDPVTVTDARGSLSGWTVTGQLVSDFTRTGGHEHSPAIPGGTLVWDPTVSLTVPAGQPGGPSGVLGEVAPGAPAALSTSEADVLCQAPAGGGGGRFDCGAGLRLGVPAGTPAGTYVATLDLIVIGL